MSLHGKRKEIYKYEAPWTVYAMNWSVRPDKRFRLALGSFVEEYNNKVSILLSFNLLLTSFIHVMSAENPAKQTVRAAAAVNSRQCSELIRS